MCVAVSYSDNFLVICYHCTRVVSRTLENIFGQILAQNAELTNNGFLFSV